MFRFMLCLGVLVAGCAPVSDEVRLGAVYQASIRAAAVRDPGFAVPLRTIPADVARVRMGTFTEWGAPDSPSSRLVWVSLPDQLREFCHGKADPVLAIQQALGVPPQAEPSVAGHQWQVVEFPVPRAALFRPCPGGIDVGVGQCSNDLAALDAATMRFMLEQIWSSDRVGFRGPTGGSDWGYPFTGMGWTYNWDPAAASPVGVTEFVMRTGTVVGDVVAVTPRDFCARGGVG